MICRNNTLAGPCHCVALTTGAMPQAVVAGAAVGQACAGPQRALPLGLPRPAVQHRQRLGHGGPGGERAADLRAAAGDQHRRQRPPHQRHEQQAGLLDWLQAAGLQHSNPAPSQPMTSSCMGLWNELQRSGCTMFEGLSLCAGSPGTRQTSGLCATMVWALQTFGASSS